MLTLEARERTTDSFGVRQMNLVIDERFATVSTNDGTWEVTFVSHEDDKDLDLATSEEWLTDARCERLWSGGTEELPIWVDFINIGPELGEVDDYEAECKRFDDCLTEACRGTPYSIEARPAQRGELCALHAVNPPHGLQVLGGSFKVPWEIEEIIDKACTAYCKG